MLNRVYSVFDKRIRPLRNHVYLAFPQHGLAYARVTEPAFQVLGPVLHRLSGTEALLTENGRKVGGTERLLFHGDVELLTARELKRRHPEMKVVAWVQDPVHRIAYCYEKIILNSEELPAYYAERHFSTDMTPSEFVTQISGISDLEADNLFRSQSAALSYKGLLTADLILPLETFEESLSTFLSAAALAAGPKPDACYRPSRFVSHSTLRAFEDEDLARKLKRRYRADYDLVDVRDTVTA